MRLDELPWQPIHDTLGSAQMAEIVGGCTSLVVVRRAGVYRLWTIERSDDHRPLRITQQWDDVTGLIAQCVVHDFCNP